MIFNLFNLTTDGGSNTNGARYAATGGGGVGGRGGNIGNNAYYQVTAGGGSAGPAEDIPNQDNDNYSNAGPGAGGSRLFRFTGPFLDGVGGVALTAKYQSSLGLLFTPHGTIGMGAGSGGLRSTEINDVPEAFQAQPAGIFGGGGGCFTGRPYGAAGGDGMVGGGGGAHTYYQTDGSPQRKSGRGGNGVVIIEYIER